MCHCYGSKRTRSDKSIIYIINETLIKKMSGVLPSWYNELHHKVVGSTNNIPRSFRAICLFTAATAFVLGIVVGVMIPLYLIPPSPPPPSPSPPPPRDVQVNLSSGFFPGAAAAVATPTTTAEEAAAAAAVEEAVSAAAASSSFTYHEEEVPLPPPPPLNVYDMVSFVPAVQRPVLPVIPAEPQKQTVNSSALEDGVYWSLEVEASLPRGYDSTSAEEWRRYARQSKVIKVEEGCGRMQNRLLTFENGSRSCCRYRQNVDQIQGEIFSFYLGRYILGLPNMAPATLARVRPQSRQWSAVRAQLSVAQWAAEERAVVLTQFVPQLGPAYIPPFLRPADRRLHPPDIVESPKKGSSSNLVELAQWSDLIVFDYLTANLDRVVNNLYNLQWNPAMMEAPAHNLAQDTESGLLLFLDNESGLLHGYRLLEKYEHFHRAMLDALCVFRRSTADVIKRLHTKNNIGELLRTIFKKSDPEFIDILPNLPEKSVKILIKRIARVYEQITKCESLYQSS